MKLLAGILISALFFGSTIAGEKVVQDSVAWSPPPYAKVVGYRFHLPGEDSKDPVPSGFTLLRNGRLDTALLEKQKLKSADLLPDEVQTLTSAINAREEVPSAACYDPHHLFVFYSDSGAVVAAIEICFGCNGIMALPGIAEPRWHRHDFIALAKLADKLGLWNESRTLQQWIDLQQEKNASPTRP